MNSITISRGAAANLGAIVQTDALTLPQLADLFRQAHTVPVSFSHDDLCAARKALCEAKAARTAAQDPAAMQAARKAVDAAEKRLHRMKAAPWWCPAEFDGTRRDRKGCRLVFGITGDADQVPTTLARLRERLDSLGCAYVLHSSTSHGAEGQERYRVFLPFAEPIAPDRYEAAWSWLAERLEGMLDPGARDATRLSYMPRCPVGATGHLVHVVDDRPFLDPAEIAPVSILAAVPAEPVADEQSDDDESPLSTATEEQVADLRSALMHAPLLQAAAAREVWAQVGIWLLSLGETGRQLWGEFSAAAPNGAPGDAEEWWEANRSTKPEKDFRAIYKMASDTYGWVNPEPARRNARAAASFSVVPDAVPRIELQTTAKGIPYSNTRNATLILAQQTNVTLTYDEFLDRVIVGWPGESPHAMEDADITRVQVELQRLGMTSMSEASTKNAMVLVARKNPSNVVTAWLDSLTWDGRRRLSLLLQHGFGASPGRYHVRAGRNMLIAMVARAMRPGCQVDEALVFEGPQGAFKSSALRILGGEHFKELTADPRSKDFEQQLRGVWLGEFPELHAMRRTDDIARIKQFITNREDHFRASYGKTYQDYPRRIVLCGSTNEECWLHDPTGGRRFIPVEVGRVDLQWLRENRDQLFAEAVGLFKAGRQWWRYPKEETLDKQAARAPDDPWESRVREYLHGRSEILDPAEILTYGVELSPERQTHAHLTRVGVLLRKLGCVRQGQRRVDGQRRRPWSVPDEFARLPLRHGPIAMQFPTVAEPLPSIADML